MYPIKNLLLIISLFSFLPVAKAFEITPSLRAGTMLQPASQYYHAIYGTTIAFKNQSTSKGALTLSYLKRPTFTSQGYADKEEFLELNFAYQIIESKFSRFTLKNGLGHAWGEISDSHTKRSYILNGFSYGLNFALFYNTNILSFEFTNFSAVDSSYNIQYFVLWPFNYLTVGLGYAI